MATCSACDARREEILWLREQHERMMGRILALSGKDSSLMLQASEAARMSPLLNEPDAQGYEYSLPPSVQEACIAMAGGEGQLYRELAAWASRQLSADGGNAEDVADQVYMGRTAEIT